LIVKNSKRRVGHATLARGLVLLLLTGVLASGSVAYAGPGSDYFLPGNLVVTRSVYDNNANNVQVGQTLPPTCVVAKDCVSATSTREIPPPWAASMGGSADKIGKDTNFRGLTISGNVLYYTKGSGGNGVNTVYFVDNTGNLCNDTVGVGLPDSSTVLPTSPLAYDPGVLQTKGLDPNNMCILKGFPETQLDKDFTPFGIWFADANTLYVAEEGDGDNTYSSGKCTNAANQTAAGLQKWIYGSGAGQWNLAYTLQTGLDFGVPYTVPGYQDGDNPATGFLGLRQPTVFAI
jgi:hypothetical protein